MDLSRRTLKKVPEVTLLFWVTKLLTTAMGESTSDYLVKAINPIVAVGIGTLVLLGVVAFQVGKDHYIPWVYWLAVLMVAIVGTMAADVLHKQFGVAYSISSLYFAAVLTVVFVAWYRVEGTLSIHSITGMGRELFYWAAVMATFALGTAAGDYTAHTLGLGYFASAVLFAVLILVPALGYRYFHMNEVLAFWFAYVLTRPVGASIADWLGKPKNLSGMALGDGPVSIAFGVLIVACVAVMTREWNRSESLAS
ncbi:MAG TPA: hypothetical protein VII96_06400 [Acidimicrobiales bacterium]